MRRSRDTPPSRLLECQVAEKARPPFVDGITVTLGLKIAVTRIRGMYVYLEWVEFEHVT